MTPPPHGPSYDADKPVSEGETHDVTIDEEGDEGDGVVRFDGYVVFVEGAKEGYTGTIRITSIGPKFGFAEPVDG